jgi:hypothetical protein
MWNQQRVRVHVAKGRREVLADTGPLRHLQRQQVPPHQVLHFVALATRTARQRVHAVKRRRRRRCDTTPAVHRRLALALRLAEAALHLRRVRRAAHPAVHLKAVSALLARGCTDRWRELRRVVGVGVAHWGARGCLLRRPAAMTASPSPPRPVIVNFWLIVLVQANGVDGDERRDSRPSRAVTTAHTPRACRSAG